MYCLYLRKSRADLELEAKGEMETLARHKKTLLELAKRQGLLIGAIYEEIVTGETIEARPEVQKLLDEVENGKWDGVLVMEVERLARGDTVDQGIVARAFKTGGAKIVTPAKTYDPNNEFDEEYFEFGLFMSRREYKTINRRIQRGRVASAKEGKYLGSVAPYGYDKVKISNDKGYTLQPNAEADTIKQIYKWYVSGDGAETIARRLDDIGIKPRRKEFWSKASISDILKNPVYIGILRWSHQAEKKYYVNGKMRKRRVLNDGQICVTGLHSAIIEKTLFDAAQEVRKKNTYKTTKESLALQNSLSGVLYCGLCGARMTRLGPNHHTKYDALRCSNRYCKNVSSPLERVEKKLVEAVSLELDAHKFNISHTERKKSDFTAAISRIEQEITALNKQISATYDLLEQGLYTADVFTARNAELDARKTAAEDKLKKLKNDAQAEEDTVILPSSQEFKTAYREAEAPRDKNSILASVLNRAEYIKTAPNRRGQKDNDSFRLDIFLRT